MLIVGNHYLLALFTNCIQLNLHEIAMMQYKNYRIKLKQ